MNGALGHWKRKLTELDEKIKKLEAELEESQNLKLRSRFEGPELDEKISYLREWIDFHAKEKIKYEAKLKSAEEADKASEPVLEKESAAFELIFGRIGEEKPKADISRTKEKIKTKEIKTEEKPVREAGKAITEIKSRLKSYKPLFKYALPLALLLFIIISLFFIKPEITGQVILSKEAEYKDILNLKINETSNYTWNLGRQANIKSIKAAGSVVGNGSVKIYIEKDGKRYLIYKNK